MLLIVYGAQDTPFILDGQSDLLNMNIRFKGEILSITQQCVHAIFAYEKRYMLVSALCVHKMYKY